jgi:phage terminase large subunit-like protein
VVALDQYNSAATIQRLRDKINITEYIWSLPKQMKAFSKLRQAFVSGKISIPNDSKLIWQLKNLVVVYKGGGWRVTGGTQAAVDDMVFALACCLDSLDDPADDGLWISAMS